MTGFLRDMAAIPSESCSEKAIVQRIKEEMEAAGFDRVVIDNMGNLLGYIGTGKHLIAMDAHVDTVGPGNIDNWHHDPYKGYEDDEVIYGLRTSDQAHVPDKKIWKKELVTAAAMYAIIPALYVKHYGE